MRHGAGALKSGIDRHAVRKPFIKSINREEFALKIYSVWDGKTLPAHSFYGLFPPQSTDGTGLVFRLSDQYDRPAVFRGGVCSAPCQDAFFHASITLCRDLQVSGGALLKLFLYLRLCLAVLLIRLTALGYPRQDTVPSGGSGHAALYPAGPQPGGEAPGCHRALTAPFSLPTPGGGNGH